MLTGGGITITGGSEGVGGGGTGGCGGGGIVTQKRDGAVDSSPSPLERILRIIFNRKSLLLHVYDP